MHTDMSRLIFEYSEKEIEQHAEALLASAGVRMVGPRKLRVRGEGHGYFEIDALGVDKGGIVVAEFKSVRDKGVIGQLMLYCHVVQETTRALGIDLPVRGLIASNNIDANWIAITQRLRESGAFDIEVLAVAREPVSGALYLRSPDGEHGAVHNAAGMVDARAALRERLQEARTAQAGLGE